MTLHDGAGSARLGLLGVPTSAGSHNAGQDKAPAALRAAGLVDRLVEHGIEVRDFGDLPLERHRPMPAVDGVRDLDRVTEIARRTADGVAEIHAAGFLPLVVGGDCTITLGVVAGLARETDVGLVYFDGDADLNLPETSESGVLDTMGMSHLLGDGATALSHLGSRQPLLAPEQVVLFGFDPGELDTGQWTRLASRRLYAVPAPAVRGRVQARAADALSWLEQGVESFVVHFDVDVLNTGAFPLANFPHFAGLTLEEAQNILETFCAGVKFAGLVVTEINPDHDPDGSMIAALCDVIAAALTQPLGLLAYEQRM
jgi:arginase